MCWLIIVKNWLVVWVVRFRLPTSVRRRDRDGVDLSQVKVSRNLMDVALDPEVEIFVELIGWM